MSSSPVKKVSLSVQKWRRNPVGSWPLPAYLTRLAKNLEFNDHPSQDWLIDGILRLFNLPQAS
jgi:hypothetical protein